MDVVCEMERHLRYWLKAATVDDWYEMYWYENMHEEMRRISDTHDTPLDVVCAITAVLSPRVTWEKNLESTEIILSTGTDVGVPGYGKNRTKALRIAETLDVSLVSGPKVTEFYHTLLNPEHKEVTVDQWMTRAAGILAPWHSSPSTKVIRLVQHAVEEVTRAINEAGDGEIVIPSMVQPVVWSSIRNRGNEWERVVKELGPVII